MQTLTLNRRAKEAYSFLKANEEVFQESSTRTSLLWYLASIYPKPATFEELSTVLGVTEAQVSRVTRAVHKIDHHGNEGLDLVEVSFDLHNPRIKLVKLSAKGIQAISDLLQQKP